jgi:CubicO group peptidase (beta-lactamase class C family)
MALSGLAFVDPHRQPGLTYLTVPASVPRPHPVALRSLPDLSEFHEQTATTSLVVLVDGVVVHEWYRDGLGPGTLFLGASATKSLLAHLVGIAVRSGALDIEAAAEKYVPELAGTGYRGVPVHDLLTMTSGVDWVEDHRDPDGPATALLSSFVAGGSSRAVLGRVGPRYPPGTRYAYCTADSQVLDWVRERATGIPFRSALTDLWRDLGGATGAVVGVDGDGVALAGGGVAATAGDWARVGLLQVDGTRPGGERLLDRAWVDDASRPSCAFLRPGRLPSPLSAHVGFGRHWWPLDDAGHRVSADGSRGQFVYVDRPRRVVVVKTSDWAHPDPEHDRHCRDLSYLTLAAIAGAARHGEVR